MGRNGNPSEVSDLCVMLASDITKYVTGQVISIDGCMII